MNIEGALNTVENIAAYVGLSDKKTRELLTSGVIPSVVTGKTRKYYNTSTTIIDIAYTMICNIHNRSFDSYKDAFLHKELTDGLNVFNNKAEIISIINQKGGVGKTTTTSNLSASLAFVGKRVLLLDMDPQCNTTSYYAPNTSNVVDIVKFKTKLENKEDITKEDINSIRKYYKKRSIMFLEKKLDDCKVHNLTKEEDEDSLHVSASFLDKLNFSYEGKSIASLYKMALLDEKITKESVQEFIVEIQGSNFKLDLLPNELKMAKIIEHSRMQPESHLILKKIIDAVKDHYDYIIIDTPPNAGLALENSLYASDRVVFASLTEEFSLEGMQYTLDEIEEIKNKTDKNIIVDGIFVNRYVQPRKNKVFKDDEVDYNDELTSFLLEELQSRNYYEVYESKTLTIAQSNKIPVFEYAGKPKEAMQLAMPFFNYIRTLTRSEV